MIFIKIIIIFLIFVSTAFAQFSLYLENKIPVKEQNVNCLKINNEGRFLALGTKSGTVYIFDLQAKRLIHTLKHHRNQVNSLIFDSKNQYLVSGADDKKIVIWDLYSGQITKVIEDFKSPIRCLEISPDDKMLTAGGSREEIYIWDFPSGFLKGVLKGHKQNVISLSFNLNGDQLLSIGKDKLMIVWDVGKQQTVRKTEIESKTMNNSGIDINCARFSFDKYFVGIGMQERVLAKGGRQMIFKYNLGFYDWKTGNEIEVIQGNKTDINFFAISPDKNYAITDNSTLRQNQLAFWNIKSGIVEQNQPMTGKISSIEISENGKWLAVANTSQASNSVINIWQISGMEGYQRFATNSPIKSATNTGFGSSMKMTTPNEPLIQFGERKKIAVMYFDSPGLSEDIAKTTSYLLEGKLGNSPFVELIERNQINSVLSELNYQMSGLTTSAAVEVGKHLNAQYILVGSINKLGNLLIITVKLVNVETAQIEGTREVQCHNATIENISDMVAMLAPAIVKY
jgi:WD40 repeat protein